MFGNKKQVSTSFEQAVTKTREALATEGFGIITEIDVKATLKKKINVDFDNYIILGACNPTLAHKALTADRDIGLTLPCNVIVYEQEGKTYVAATTPTRIATHFENTTIVAISTEVEQKLQKVIESI